MQLATYINDLLYRYECVIIPGFGAFLTQYQSAKIDPETHTFYPPGKTLSFNRQLQTNDGLLANYVASVENSSYEIALQQIRNFTGTLSLQLSEGETVTLLRIGEFFLNKEQSVQFVPAPSANFSTASFGLSSYVSRSINREVYKETVAALEEKAPLLFTPERRTALPYLKYAAIGLIAIALSGFVGMKLYEGNVQKHNFVEKQKANTLVENQIQEATFVLENPLPSLNITLPKRTGKYHIIAGAFRVEENAQTKVAQLIEKGYSPRLIGINRYGLHQVIYSSHENRLEALQTLHTIKRTENVDAWLLVQDMND
ncbi:sporulation related protein [Ulvibacter sp. MAR_2010_11]|uniref:HU domain-containing protein n=1 Tax=Ulvibacter sp. MAR_2010_11 TaxID=1250229 RepID=UPI000C2CAF8D|nr:SPOR domain-containing protein [Ulvibacter sp. MAR_2010_11]PKA82881.1 sporulation related protein [Ulvibacter sp. MAR_2010_11]